MGVVGVAAAVAAAAVVEGSGAAPDSGCRNCLRWLTMMSTGDCVVPASLSCSRVRDDADGGGMGCGGGDPESVERWASGGRVPVSDTTQSVALSPSIRRSISSTDTPEGAGAAAGPLSSNTEDRGKDGNTNSPNDRSATDAMPDIDGESGPTSGSVGAGNVGDAGSSGSPPAGAPPTVEMSTTSVKPDHTSSSLSRGSPIGCSDGPVQGGTRRCE